MNKYWFDLCGPKPNCSDEFIKGVKAGLQAYAWWKDGVQYVGTTGQTLKEALREVDEQLGGENTNGRGADG